MYCGISGVRARSSFACFLHYCASDCQMLHNPFFSLPVHRALNYHCDDVIATLIPILSFDKRLAVKRLFRLFSLLLYCHESSLPFLFWVCFYCFPLVSFTVFRYTFNDVVNYLKWRKLTFMVRGQVCMKPMFINTTCGQHLIFTVSPGSDKSREYYVCVMCDRGFPSRNGLFSHQQSAAHQEMLASYTAPLRVFIEFHR